MKTDKAGCARWIVDGDRLIDTSQLLKTAVEIHIEATKTPAELSDSPLRFLLPSGGIVELQGPAAVYLKVLIRTMLQKEGFTCTSERPNAEWLASGMVSQEPERPTVEEPHATDPQFPDVIEAPDLLMRSYELDPPARPEKATISLDETHHRICINFTDGGLPVMELNMSPRVAADLGTQLLYARDRLTERR